MAPIEFICLLQLAVVAIVMAMLPVIGKVQVWGIRRYVGHPTPEDAPLPAWVQRADRAHLKSDGEPDSIRHHRRRHGVRRFQ